MRSEYEWRCCSRLLSFGAFSVADEDKDELIASVEGLMELHMQHRHQYTHTHTQYDGMITKMKKDGCEIRRNGVMSV